MEKVTICNQVIILKLEKLSNVNFDSKLIHPGSSNNFSAMLKFVCMYEIGNFFGDSVVDVQFH